MTSVDLPQLLDFAVSAVAGAAHLSMAAYGKAEVRRKADDSEVTAADLRIQRMLCERIRARYPDHAVLCEEEGDYLAGMPQPGTRPWCWVIDPIDGTRNFTRGLPWFGTSLGLLHDGTPTVGVINHHPWGRTYAAARGLGATCGGRPLSVSASPFDGRTVVAFQPDSAGAAFTQADRWLRLVNLRNLGSTALHLALLAEGVLDGAFCLKSHLWDIAAGAVLVSEARGRLTDPQGHPLFPVDLAVVRGGHTPFVAGNPQVHAGLISPR